MPSIGEDTTHDGRSPIVDQNLRDSAPHRNIPSRNGHRCFSGLGVLMDGSAYRNMPIGELFKILLGFAALGAIASIGVFLWSIYLILSWIF